MAKKRTYTLPVGPYHPMLAEPENFMVTLEGERIVDVEINLGYNHRAIERVATLKGNAYQTIETVQRICGICSEAHAVPFCQGVERILGIEAPKRAKYIRTILLELNRLQSHILWLGLFAYQMGFETLFHHTWADREIVLDLTETITGNRIHYSMETIGGVRRDVSNEKLKKIEKGMRELKKRLKDRTKVFETDSIVNKRLEGVGILSKGKARECGVVGPTLRGSDVKVDTRADTPYVAYSDFDFDVITEKACDSKARMTVRIGEVFESIRIIRQALDRMPKGKINDGKKYFNLKGGKTVSIVEAPRGENVHYIIVEGKRLKRLRVRPPTYANFGGLKEMLKGGVLADIPPILNSMDPCFCCTDRVVVLDLDEGKRDVINMEDLWKCTR